MERINIRFLSNDNQYNEWKEGDQGVIDGYVQGGDNRPFACIANFRTARIVLAPIHAFEII